MRPPGPVHPFVDGNGRGARIMMNADLVCAAERRIIVPTIHLSSYLGGLKARSQNGVTRTLIRALDFLQRLPDAEGLRLALP